MERTSLHRPHGTARRSKSLASRRTLRDLLISKLLKKNAHKTFFPLEKKYFSSSDSHFFGLRKKSASLERTPPAPGKAPGKYAQASPAAPPAQRNVKKSTSFRLRQKKTSAEPARGLHPTPTARRLLPERRRPCGSPLSYSSKPHRLSGNTPRPESTAPRTQTAHPPARRPSC